MPPGNPLATEYRDRATRVTGGVVVTTVGDACARALYDGT